MTQSTLVSISCSILCLSSCSNLIVKKNGESVHLKPNGADYQIEYLKNDPRTIILNRVDSEQEKIIIVLNKEGCSFFVEPHSSKNGFSAYIIKKDGSLQKIKNISQILQTSR